MIESKKWVCITELENIPLREGRAVHIGGRDIAIFNLGGRFLALENRCPHQGGPLAEGMISGTNVVCPLHAWKVNVESGTVMNRPDAAKCVETFSVSVSEGLVFLELPIAPKTRGENPDACGDTKPMKCWADSSALSRNGAESKNLGA